MPVFADETTSEYSEQGALLKDLGVLNGDENGNLNLDSTLDRQTLMLMIARLMGEEETAMSYPFAPTFDDAKELPWIWSNVIAWAQFNQISNGMGDNKFGPTEEVNAAMLQTLLLRVLGFDPVWGEQGALAEELGLLNGLQDVETVTRGYMAAMAANALDVEKADGSQTLAAELGIEMPRKIASVADVAEVTVVAGEEVVLPETVTATLDNDTTEEVAVVWNTEDVNTAIAGTYAAAGTVDVYGGYEVTATVVVEPGDLSVVDITTVNFAEVEIEFNKAIDKESLSVENVKVNNVALVDNTDSMVLLDDNKTVRIYDADDFTTTQQQQLKLTVTGIKAADGQEQPVIKDEVITFTDLEFPQLVDVTSTGNKRLSLTFSEPVANAVHAKIFANYKIDSKAVIGSGQPSVDGRTIVLNLAKGLTSGEHTITVTAGTIKDRAGFAIAEQNIAFAVVDDKVAPTFSVTSVAPEQVELQFDEEINGLKLRVYWKQGLVKHYGTITKDSADKTIVYATFANTHYIPLTETVLYVEGAVDYSGNTAATSEISVIATPDITRPEVVSVTSTKENEIIVEFSEKVKVNDASEVYTVKDNEGNTVAAPAKAYVVDANSNPVKNKIKLVGTYTPTKNSYVVTVNNVVDLSSLGNRSLLQAFTVDIPDKTAPSVANVTKDGQNIAITFDEQVDPATSADLANYAYFEAGYGYVALPEGTVVTPLSDSKTVLLTFPANWKFNSSSNNRTIVNISGTNALSIRNIADLTGNVMFATLQNVGATGETAALINTVKATDKHTLVLSLEATGNLPTTVYAGDFDVKANATSLTVTDAQLDTTNRRITLTISEELTAIAQYSATPVTVDAVTTVALTKTALGTPIDTATGNPVQVTDSISPSVLADGGVVVNNGTIKVTFDEAINYKIGDATTLANALVIKDRNGNRLLPTTDYTASIANVDADKFFTITLIKNGFSDIVTIELDSIYLSDASPADNCINAIVANTGSQVFADVTAPAALNGGTAITEDAAAGATDHVTFTDNATTAVDTLAFDTLANDVASVKVTISGTIYTGTVSSNAVTIEIGDNTGVASAAASVVLVDSLGNESTATAVTLTNTTNTNLK
jgi:Big-like domain-containing protein/S-layer family protein